MNNEFTTMLNAYRNGQLCDDLADEMRCLMAAIEETNKPGELTLTLRVSPPHHKTGAIHVQASVKSKAPMMPREKQTYFCGDNGMLQSHHPKQNDMFENVTNITDRKKEEAGS